VAECPSSKYQSKVSDSPAPARPTEAANSTAFPGRVRRVEARTATRSGSPLRRATVTPCGASKESLPLRSSAPLFGRRKAVPVAVA
jgi:hypothetical protein